jgi:hypothetical protein
MERTHAICVRLDCTALLDLRHVPPHVELVFTIWLAPGSVSLVQLVPTMRLQGYIHHVRHVMLVFTVILELPRVLRAPLDPLALHLLHRAHNVRLDITALQQLLTV